MYGTIGHIQIKPGMESALTRYIADFKNNVPGVISCFLYCMDKAAHDYYWTVVWTDQEAHDASGNREDAAASYDQFLSYLSADPEWHSGDCVYAAE